MFFRLLQKLECESTISRKYIVARLQSYHEAFYLLDEITFCRWINGTTTPSFYKQIQLTKFFSMSFFEFVDFTDFRAIPKKQESVFNKVLKEFDCSYHAISYSYIADSNPVLKFQSLNSDDHWELLGSFYRNIGSINNIAFMLEKKRINVNSHVFSVYKNNKISSHTTCVLDALLYFDALGLVFKGVSHKSVFINVSYYSSSEFFRVLLGCALLHIQSLKRNVDNVYFAFRGGQFLSFVELLGGEVIWADRGRSEIGIIYVCKFDYVQFISNPLIFNLIKCQKNNYIDLKNSGELLL